MLQRSVFRASRQATRAASRFQPAFVPLQRQIGGAVRYYAEQPAAKNGEAAQTNGNNGAPAADEISQLKQELEKKNKEVIDLKDRYLRSVADFQNLQDRTKREVQAAKDFALQKFSKDLIESIDNLERALDNVPAEKLNKETNNDLVSLYEGLKMIDTILLNTLKKHGLVRFDPAAELEPFDPNTHEAVFMAPQPDKEDGVVFHTQQKGFKLNGRVLRAAKVGVVKNS